MTGILVVGGDSALIDVLRSRGIQVVTELPKARNPIPPAQINEWPEPLTKGQQYLRDVGETPDSMRLHRERDRKAQAKRDSRIERNIRNEAAQGREPYGLERVSGAWMASCGMCGERYEFGADAAEFDPHYSYCGGSERCCP